MSRYNENLRRAQERKRAENAEKVGFGAAIAVLVLLLLVLSGFITELGWNHGVSELIRSCGGHADGINLWQAICVNLSIAVISRVFCSNPPAKKQKG